MATKLWKAGTSNARSTTLNGSIGAGDTSITLTSVTGLQSPGVITIDRVNTSDTETPTVREYISYTGISTNTLTGCTRGLGGSTAQSHSSGAIVEETFNVTHWNDMVDFLMVAHDAGGNIVTSTATIATLIVDTVKVATSIADINANELFKVVATTDAVNEVTVTNAATGNAPLLSATGGDTNIDLKLSGKGTGKIRADSTYGAITDQGSQSSGTITLNWATSNRHKITLTGDSVTIAHSNQVAGQTALLEVIQDGTGTQTITAWTGVTWAGGTAPTLTTTASKKDLIGFFYDGSATIGFVVAQNI